MTAHEPTRAELAWALKKAREAGVDPWTLAGACASVGIEHGMTTNQMIWAWATAQLTSRGA